MSEFALQHLNINMVEKYGNLSENLQTCKAQIKKETPRIVDVADWNIR